MKKYIAVVILVSFLAVPGYLLVSSNKNQPEQSSSNSQKAGQTNQTEQSNEPQEFDKDAHSLESPTSIWVIANKSRPLPADYRPADLLQPNVPILDSKSRDEMSVRGTIAKPLETMLADAAAEGINLRLASGFRSYDLQQTYYESYVRTYGQAEADRFSARPGTSEHQTGLVVDLSTIGSSCYLDACFATEPGGKWVAENGHKYGFIVRYPESKESITGYIYEPWHLRYVGMDLAAEVNKQGGVTLEEFFGLTKND